MTKSISASVGKNGTNKPNDVKIIQELLNRVSRIHGGPLSPLKVDGLCGGITLKAIDIFQKTGCNFKWPDQLIEPAGKTWGQLLVVAKDEIWVDENLIVGPPFWGVDSVAPAHKKYRSEPEPTLYDYITRLSNGGPPAFFGRYLTTDSEQRIEFDEILFLASKKCKILLCYNGMETYDVKTRERGLFHANRAADRAKALGVRSSIFSPSVWIYANIDSNDNSYKPTKDWMAGWWDGLWDRGYGPGTYYSASPISNLIERSFKECKKIPGPPSRWLSAWTSHNHSGARNCKNGKYLRIPPQFSPAQPHTLGIVDVWQYARDCNNAFDMNLANQRGYDKMWNVSSVVGFYPDFL